MARNLTDDYGAFDHNAERGGKNDTGSIFRRVIQFLTNRYLVLGIGFVAFGVAILIMTTRLQFSNYQNTLSQSSSGVIRQYSSQAPRGDIYDSRGVLLASSIEYNTVMIANAYLDDAQLNSLCLELSYLFDEYHCIDVADLDQYFILDPKARFVKSEDKIRLWQTDSNLFDLKDYSSGVIVTFSTGRRATQKPMGQGVCTPSSTACTTRESGDFGVWTRWRGCFRGTARMRLRRTRR